MMKQISGTTLSTSSLTMYLERSVMVSVVSTVLCKTLPQSHHQQLNGN